MITSAKTYIKWNEKIFKLSGALSSLTAMFLKFLVKIVDLAEGFFGHRVVFFLTDSYRFCPQTEAICGCIFASGA